MQISSKQINSFLIAVLIVGGISCKGVTSGDTTEIVESLEPVEEVFPVEGGESVSLVVNINTDKQAYFDLEFRNIQSNSVIGNGEFDGWCIDVFKSINSNDGIYLNVNLFSTDMVEKWMPINYLLNIREELKAEDGELTWLEFQVAVWSLRAYPKFDLNDVEITDLPGQFHKDGEPLFNYQKVEDILELVNSEYSQYDYTKKGTKYAIIAELPVDVQTVFAVVEKK